MDTMALNIDNALTDTQERLLQLIRTTHYAVSNTPENEPLWLVSFVGHRNELLVAEVILRDNAIVMSVLNTIDYSTGEVTRIMGVFMELLNIV
jgi:hypothetical protein